MRRALRIAVFCGSPRLGACARLCDVAARGVLDAGGEPVRLNLRDYAVRPCDGCGACEADGACRHDPLEAAPADGKPGFASLLGGLCSCDALFLVSPVFFAGPPAQLKAFFDRMQALWARRYVLGERPVLAPFRRRPFDLCVVGGGGDPFGFEPLVTCARSALRMADFELRRMVECVGYPQASNRAGGSAANRWEGLVRDGAAELLRCSRSFGGLGPTAERG